LLNQIKEPKTEARLLHRARASVAIAVLMMGAMGILSWRIAHQAAQDAGWVAHTYEVTGTMELTLRHLDDVETGTRGFALTGQDQLLQPYSPGVYATERDLERLRFLTRDNPDQQRRLGVLAEQARNMLDQAAQLVDTRRNSGKTPAVVYLDGGQRLMDVVRGTIAGMEAVEKRLLELRVQRAEYARRFTNFAIGWGWLLGAVLLSIAGVAINREISATTRSQSQVKVLTEDLERRVAERTDSEARYRGLLEAAPDAMVVVNQDGGIVLLNVQAEKQFGYQRDELLDQKITRIIPEGFAERLIADEIRTPTEALAQQIDMGIELSGRRKDGSRFPIEIMLSPLESAEGILVTAAIRNISARNKSERDKAELARYTEALERSNQELDAFAYAVSHDLKAPLRVIHNASMWIEEDLAGNLTAEIRENMTLLRSRVRRMDRLLDDLLTYSRIGRETDSTPAEAIAGTTLIENILGLLSPPQGFIVDATSMFAGIEVFRMPLQQILINLISNAIKHHDKKEGRIEVSVEDLGAMFRFRVKDDGPGIPPQYQEQVFKMFKTLKPRDQVEGSGMGLAMVRKHIDVVGGELTLESVVGQGSTFCFTWPKRGINKQNTKYSFAGVKET
jgi:PAS domain S-box-containing protein